MLPAAPARPRSPRPDCFRDDHSTGRRDAIPRRRLSGRRLVRALPSHITVDLSLQDDAITDVSITNHATDPTSLGYQEAFAEAIGEIAIGQPLDDADVDIVAGASGTSEGWNSALDLIREDARS